MQVRIIFFILLSLFSHQLLLSANENITNAELKDYELTGNVKKFSEKIFTAAGNRENIIKRGMTSGTEYIVVRNNNVFPVKITEPGTITSYVYNEKYQVREVAVTHIKDGTSRGKRLYFYDEYSNPCLELSYGISGRLQDSVVINFDKTLLNREETAYNSRGKFLYRVAIRYNNFGKIERKTKMTFEATTKFIYTYDSTGMLVEEKWYLNDVIAQKIGFEYNEIGKLVRKILYDENDKPYSSTDYEYDISTEFLKQVTYNNYINNYEYNYDSYGNWIVRYEYYNNIPVTITEREIVYEK